MHHFLKDLTIMLSEMAFHAAETHRVTSGRSCTQRAVEGKVLIRTANQIFFRLRNPQKLVRIRFGCGLDSRIYGICDSMNDTRLAKEVHLPDWARRDK